jgi:Cu+-exporting ATPase
MEVTDPVCGMSIDSDKALKRETWQGQTYYFCSKSCQETFRSAPDRYADKAGDRGARDSQTR